MADEVVLAIHASSGMSLPVLIFLRDVDIPFSEEHYEVAPASQTWVLSSSRKSPPYQLVDPCFPTEIYSRNDLYVHATSLQAQR